MRNASLILAILISLHYGASYVTAADSIVSPEEFRQAVAFFKKNGEPTEIKRFERQPAARKAMLLGSTYWHHATKGQSLVKTGSDGPTSHELARRQLLLASANSEGLTSVETGYVFMLLGMIDDVRGNRLLAETSYRKSMALGNEEACVNLGAMWEHSGDYDKALSIYQGCLPELKSSVLLMNLGSIYYNGLGRPRDHRKGAGYWQQSFDLFGYDPDVNYNLGLHHFQDTGDLDKARYHFALAEAMGDKGAREKLAVSVLRKRDASGQFADELRKADETQRRWKIEARLRYTLGERFLNYPQNGLTFRQVDNGNRLLLSGKAKDEKEVLQAVTLMFRLLYLDRLAWPADEVRALQESLAKHGEAELLKHGIRHKIAVDRSKLLSYEVRFD